MLSFILEYLSFMGFWIIYLVLGTVSNTSEVFSTSLLEMWRQQSGLCSTYSSEHEHTEDSTAMLKGQTTPETRPIKKGHHLNNDLWAKPSLLLATIEKIWGHFTLTKRENTILKFKSGTRETLSKGNLFFFFSFFCAFQSTENYI